MTDTHSESSRLDALEIRITHQDAVIDDLNAAVTQQWKLIDRLVRQVAMLTERAEAAEAAIGGAAPVDKPPHY